MSRLPLRLRVALAFALTTAVSLVGLGFFVYLRVADGLGEHLEETVEAELDAIDALPPADRADAVRPLVGEIFAQWLAPDGTVVAGSATAPDPLVDADDLPGDGTRWLDRSVPLLDEDEVEHEATTLAIRRYDDGVLVVGTSREDADETLGELRSQLLVGGLSALVVASVLGYVVAGGGLRPIERMRARASTISARSAGERLPLPPARDELHRLGRTLNEMLDRLDAGLRRERQFVAEAGHELRTPLALLRLEIDLALARERSNGELTAALASAGEEVDRLSSLAEDLLAIATSDEGSLELDTAELDAGALAEEVVGRFRQRAASVGRTLDVETGSGAVSVTADRRRLDQVLTNLVDNALRHGAGAVRVAVRPAGTHVELTVADEGDGPPDPARGADHRPGAEGLGLAIVGAIVRAHGGQVVTSGGAVTVRLPR